MKNIKNRVTDHDRKLALKKIFSAKADAARRYASLAFLPTLEPTPTDEFDVEQAVPAGVRFVKHLKVAALYDYDATHTKTLTREVAACTLLNVAALEAETTRTDYFRDLREPLLGSGGRVYYHKCMFHGMGYALHTGRIKFVKQVVSGKDMIYVSVDDTVERMVNDDDNLAILVDDGDYVKAGQKIFWLKKRAPSKKMAGRRSLNPRQFDLDSEQPIYDVFSLLDERSTKWTTANDERWRKTYDERKAEVSERLTLDPPKDKAELADMTQHQAIYKANKLPSPRAETSPEDWGPIRYAAINVAPVALPQVAGFACTPAFKRDFTYWISKGAPIRARKDIELLGDRGQEQEDSPLTITLQELDGEPQNFTYCESAQLRKEGVKYFKQGDTVLYLLPELRHQDLDGFEEVEQLLDSTISYFISAFLAQTAVSPGEFHWDGDSVIMRTEYLTEALQDTIVTELLWDLSPLARFRRDNGLMLPPPVRLDGTTSFKARDLMIDLHPDTDSEYSYTEISHAEKTTRRKSRKAVAKTVN